MLTNLHVKNFAIIDEADIDLTDNLNALTGETGAGKSILLGAVNMALGAKVQKDIIGKNADYALAELTFSDISEKAREAAAESGFDIEVGEIIISRKLGINGRSVSRINGEVATAAAIKQIAAYLIDLYGQHEHQSLLDNAKHLEIVDEFSGAEAALLKEDVKNEYDAYCKLRKESESMKLDASARQREADLLSFELNEIEQVQLKEGEEEQLRAEYKLLSNSRVISDGISSACEFLNGEDGCGKFTGNALKALSRISGLSDEIDEFFERINDIDSCISDLYREMSDYLEDMPDGSERLIAIEERLDIISHLKSKYGNSVSEIAVYAERAAERLSKLQEYDAYVEKLSFALKTSEKKLSELSERLSKLRQRNAVELEGRICESLSELNFNRVIFKIQFGRRDAFGSDGIDTAEFLISVNPGEEPKSLGRIASGGELSRIMLAIKSVLAAKDDIGTLIFDEIDAGISGRTAQKVSEKLAGISANHQVICITHLPQIAAMADSHFGIEKVADKERTTTLIRRLNEEEAENELARLLGGAEITLNTRASAKEMKALACDKKLEIRKRITI